MSAITVTTQAELDAALREHGDDASTTIIIDSPRGVWVTISDTGKATVSAWGSATVEARGSATVRAWDSATVRAWDSATVEAFAEQVRSKALGPDFGRNPMSGADSRDARLYGAYDDGLECAARLIEEVEL